jgi:hypothetical protein
MRILAVLALAPALFVAATPAAHACGDGVEVVVPRESPAVLVSRARALEMRAADADAEAAQAARKARKLDAVARRLRMEAQDDETIDLVAVLEQADQLGRQAAESRAHARRASRRAVSFRNQARALRERAADLRGGGMHRRSVI